MTRKKEENRLIDLNRISKEFQTEAMVLQACSQNGLMLRYASKKRITADICEIAVKQNGLALQYVPEAIIHSKDSAWYKDLCKQAVQSHGGALRFVPASFITRKMVDKAVSYRYSYERYQRMSTPVLAYVPPEFLTPEICMKAVIGNPLSLQYVPKEFLNPIICEKATVGDSRSLRFVPQKYKTQEMCMSCFAESVEAFPYIPKKYLTIEMCISVISSDYFRFNLSDRAIEIKQECGFDAIRFTDIPDRFRNDTVVLNKIIEIKKADSEEIIEWNNGVKRMEKEGIVESDRRGDKILPLKTKTIQYLQPKDKRKTRDVKARWDVRIPEKPGEILLPIPRYTKSYGLIPYSTGKCVLHNLENNLNMDPQTFYYIFDLHLEHQLQKQLVKIKNVPEENRSEVIKEIVRKKLQSMVKDVHDYNGILLVGGDVAFSMGMAAAFYQALYELWKGVTIISVLGNHELWDGSGPEQWEDPLFVSRSVDEIVKDYRNMIMHGTKPNNYHKKSILLENELYIVSQEGIPHIISEKKILNLSDEKLKKMLSKCRLILLGGIGFSGLNPMHNALTGLYRKAITSSEEDQEYTRRFRTVYEKVLRCAKQKQVIVFTHMPVYDWTDDPCNPNWIYVNGHTHHNGFIKKPGEAVILSDNQMGYKPCPWVLKSFKTNKLWYDPFLEYCDGIYAITKRQYMEFNNGRGIYISSLSLSGKIIMLKRGKWYLFLFQSKVGLYILFGGRKKRLQNTDVEYYYDNLKKYCENLCRFYEPYYRRLRRLAEEVKQINGTGIIHGSIVDISYTSHLNLNPYDGKITSYWAKDTSCQTVYDNVKSLLVDREPSLVRNYMIENKKENLALLGDAENSVRNESITILPQIIEGSKIYTSSRLLRAMQYVYEQNVVRIWEDGMLGFYECDKNLIEKQTDELKKYEE